MDGCIGASERACLADCLTQQQHSPAPATVCFPVLSSHRPDFYRHPCTLPCSCRSPHTCWRDRCIIPPHVWVGQTLPGSAASLLTWLSVPQGRWLYFFGFQGLTTMMYMSSPYVNRQGLWNQLSCPHPCSCTCWLFDLGQVLQWSVPQFPLIRGRRKTRSTEDPGTMLFCSTVHRFYLDTFFLAGSDFSLFICFFFKSLFR